MRNLSIPPPPEGRPLRILALGAHCDDIEIGCGGMLLRLLSERPGSAVHWEVFASTPERGEEAHTSAAAFTDGAGEITVVVHAFRDGYLPDEWALIKDAFEKLKGGFDPDVVLTHHAQDAHQDHRTVAQLTWNTFRDHLVLEYEIPKYDGDLGQPNLLVPIGEATLERKIDLLMTHFPSQRDRQWFDPDVFRSIARLRGMEANATERYAEAFYCRKTILSFEEATPR